MNTTPWTPEMQRIWNEVMHTWDVETCYGRPIPARSLVNRIPPAAGLVRLALFYAAHLDRIESHHAKVLADMQEWKGRLTKSPAGIDLSSLIIDI